MDRRGFLRLSATAAFVSLGQGMWRALASHDAPVPGPSPYGPLGAPDPATGVRLPADFTVREIARATEPVGARGHLWHWYPDGGATFGTPDGGWIYVSNSEVAGAGGAGAVRFDAAGGVVDAYPILTGSNRNCAGGSTPWGTWLSCEEAAGGRVFECDPLGMVRALPRHALGMFEHEAAVVDPRTGIVYLTEDHSSGRFYRFRPALPYPPVDNPLGLDPSPLALLAAGTLEVAVVTSGSVSWVEVPMPFAVALGDGEPTTPTRYQVPESTVFRRGEGAWFDDDARTVYFCTTSDNTIWAHHVDDATIEPFFSSASSPGSPLNGADNITVSPSGEIFVCEDHGATGGPLQIVLVSAAHGVVATFLELSAMHDGSEITGVAFDPSGTRMYFSSQRAHDLGATYEVTGPF